jgi:hypothetical protein
MMSVIAREWLPLRSVNGHDPRQEACITLGLATMIAVIGISASSRCQLITRSIPALAPNESPTFVEHGHAQRLSTASLGPRRPRAGSCQTTETINARMTGLATGPTQGQGRTDVILTLQARCVRVCPSCDAPWLGVVEPLEWLPSQCK